MFVVLSVQASLRSFPTKSAPCPCPRPDVLATLALATLAGLTLVAGRRILVRAVRALLVSVAHIVVGRALAVLALEFTARFSWNIGEQVYCVTVTAWWKRQLGLALR